MQGITGVNEKVRLKMTIVNPPTYCANSVNYIVPKTPEISLELLLGILNSKLMNWCFKTLSTNSNVNGYEVDNLPLIKNLLSNNHELVNLVNELLNSTNEKLVKVNEEKIDQMVYKFYGLTDKEQAIIEESVK